MPKKKTILPNSKIIKDNFTSEPESKLSRRDIIKLMVAGSASFVVPQWIRASFGTLVQEPGITPLWYLQSLIHSHHSTGLPAPEWNVQFEKVRPDAVQFHVNAYSQGKELSKKYNFSMVATLNRSGGWGDIRGMVEALPEDQQKLIYRRVNPDGSPAGRMRDGTIWEHVCYHSPGIYDTIIPEYKRVTEQYHPDQFWIDHTIVTVNLCYCENCRKNFREQYSVEPPVLIADLYWDEWVKYHRDGFEKWMKAVYDLVRSVDEKTLVTYNGAYFIAQPEPPPPFIKNLSMDVHSQLMHLCLYARYASTVGVPFDLMSGLTDRWAGKIPKSIQEVEQTAAVITANGGRWNIGEFPMSQIQQPADKMLELALAGANQVRERQKWIHLTEPVPLVAVLQSASTQYSRVLPRPQYEIGEGGEFVVSDNGMTVFMGKDNPGKTRIYWYNNLCAPHEIYGAGAALLENNIPFDIINESTLKKRLKDYKLLIVGDQFRLDKETVAAIRSFVDRGGGLMATGRTIETDLAGLLGVRLVSVEPLKKGLVTLKDSSITIEMPLHIETDGAEVVRTFTGGSQSPAITSKKFGRGHIIYVAGDFFKTYMDVSPYTPWARSRDGNKAMRETVEAWIAEIAPNLGFSCKAPPWIEIALRNKGRNLYVQFVERSFEWNKDLYPTNSPIELKMDMKKRPVNVLLQPGARKIKWMWQDENLFATIPLNEVKTHSILEIEEGLK